MLATPRRLLSRCSMRSNRRCASSRSIAHWLSINSSSDHPSKGGSSKRPDPPLSRPTGRGLPQRRLTRRVVTNRPTPHLPLGSAPADTQRVKESPGGEAGAFQGDVHEETI